MPLAQRDNSSVKYRSHCPIFPNPSFVPAVGELTYLPLVYSRNDRIIYIAACVFLSRINVFRRSFPTHACARQDETKTGTNLQDDDVSRACLSLWPRGINNISRDLLEFLSPSRSSRPRWTPRRRDRVTDVHPSRGDPDGYAGFDENKRMLV